MLIQYLSQNDKSLCEKPGKVSSEQQNHLKNFLIFILT